MHFEKGIHFVSDPPSGAHQRQIRSEDNCEEIGAEERRYCIKDIIASHIVLGNVFYLFFINVIKGLFAVLRFFSIFASRTVTWQMPFVTGNYIVTLILKIKFKRYERYF